MVNYFGRFVDDEFWKLEIVLWMRL